MTRKLLVQQAAVLLAFLLAGIMTFADDTTPPINKSTTKKPTIEFKRIIDNAKIRETRSFIVILEVEGSDEKVEIKIKVIGTVEATTVANAVTGQIDSDSGLKYNQDKAKVEFEGWTDPKTKKFYPVRKIKFESPNVPKEYWPTITMPAE